MSLVSDLDAEHNAVARITAVARRTCCSIFTDILWSPCPHPMDLMEDPGVMFESSRRVVVLQRIAGELRYYAGGWCLDQTSIYSEQDRAWAEGRESGVLRSVADALIFAEQYLVEERSFVLVQVPRNVRYSRHTHMKVEPQVAPPSSEHLI